MATNETDFQKEIVKQINKVDFGYALRMRHFSMGGVLDLYVDQPYVGHGLPHGFHGWIECKFIKKNECVIDLTELQRATMRKIQAAGGMAGWIVCRQIDSTTWELHSGANPHQKILEPLNMIQTRKRGKPWLLKEAMENIKADMQDKQNWTHMEKMHTNPEPN